MITYPQLKDFSYSLMSFSRASENINRSVLEDWKISLKINISYKIISSLVFIF